MTVSSSLKTICRSGNPERSDCVDRRTTIQIKINKPMEIQKWTLRKTRLRQVVEISLNAVGLLLQHLVSQHSHCQNQLTHLRTFQLPQKRNAQHVASGVESGRFQWTGKPSAPMGRVGATIRKAQLIKNRLNQHKGRLFGPNGMLLADPK
jgi:hypothetical protein